MFFVAIAAASAAYMAPVKFSCDLGAILPLEGKYPVSRIAVSVDTATNIVNGFPARITETEIEWEHPLNGSLMEGKTPSLATYIDRRTGAIRVQLSGGSTMMAGRCFVTDATTSNASTPSPPPKAPVALICHLESIEGSDSGRPLGDRTFILDENQSNVDGWQATYTPYEIRFSFEGGSAGKTTKFNVVINRVSGRVLLTVDGLGPLSQGKCDRAGAAQF